MGKGWKVGAVREPTAPWTRSAPLGLQREVQGQCRRQVGKGIAVIADGLRFGVEKSLGCKLWNAGTRAELQKDNLVLCKERPREDSCELRETAVWPGVDGGLNYRHMMERGGDTGGSSEMGSTEWDDFWDAVHGSWKQSEGQSCHHCVLEPWVWQQPGYMGRCGAAGRGSPFLITFNEEEDGVQSGGWGGVRRGIWEGKTWTTCTAGPAWSGQHCSDVSVGRGCAGLPAYVGCQSRETGWGLQKARVSEATSPSALAFENEPSTSV